MRILNTLLCLAALLLAASEPAGATTFTVNPTRITLSRTARSTLLTVRNEGDTPVRIQVTAHAWSQRLGGEMQLDDTTDLIVFPTLFALAPGGERKVRVAGAVAAGPAEKTYRVFVQELPPEAGAEGGVAGVRMLTRMGIPVFIQPDEPSARAGLRGLVLADGRFAFRVENLGNVHFLPADVRVIGSSEAGERIGARSTHGWYILAGGARGFELPLDDWADCQRVRRLTVEVEVSGIVLEESLQTPQGVCPG